MPTLTGLSHVTLTVTDLVASRRFWHEVIGSPVVLEAPNFFMCLYAPTMTAIACKDHQGAAAGSFKHTVPGLDHLALGVADVAELERWASHLDFHAMTFSPIEESEFGHHLNVQAPDGIAVELFVLNEAGIRVIAASL
jgi:catechol 2,3-dioxygenase-like lactoylglutathione lyase family enzyme